MRVVGLDNQEYNWPPKGCRARPQCSELHARARNILHQLYPTMAILEEVTIPGSKLKIDLYVPTLQLAVEVQGQQHSEFTKHFHGNQWGFSRAKNNDKQKRSWCDTHGIKLIELQYDRTDDEWTTDITNSD